MASDDRFSPWLLRTAILLTISLLIFIVTMMYQLNTEIALMKADLNIVHQDHLDFRSRFLVIEQTPPFWLKSQQDLLNRRLDLIERRLR